MKKISLRDKIRYRFDCLMSQGTAAMIVLLVALTLTAVCLIAVVAYFIAGEKNFIYQVWMSFMHTLDPGTLAGNDTGNVPYVIMMTIATLFGLFITSTLIGIISSGVEGKLNALRKGNSTVQEQGHTTIIGFNNYLFSLLRELIEANTNKRDACIVILGEQPKEEMEEMIAAHLPDTKTTRIVVRSGVLHEPYSFARCSVEKSKSVIVNVHHDAETIKIILALAAYIKDKKGANDDLRFIASLQEAQNVEAANIAGEGRAKVIHTKDFIARIIASTCRQHGLSQVFTELFNFSGNEFYFEDIPEMIGKSVKDVAMGISNAIVVGVYSQGNVKLNPSRDTTIQQGDQLILLEEDDGAYMITPAGEVTEEYINVRSKARSLVCDHLIVFGSNDKLSIVLKELNKYVSAGTHVTIVDDDFAETSFSGLQNLDISICRHEITRNYLCGILQNEESNILLLNDDSKNPEQSDAMTLLRLILLRDIADASSKHFLITTEMQNVDNRRLASQARVDDFVIGSDFASLLMAQMSENHRVTELIAELLDEGGAELYMKPASDYIVLGQKVSIYTVVESAARKGEVFIGYRKNQENVVVNPIKADMIIFNEEDQIVVIAEG